MTRSSPGRSAARRRRRGTTPTSAPHLEHDLGSLRRSRSRRGPRPSPDHPRHGAAEVVRDPDAVERERDEPRLEADLVLGDELVAGAGRPSRRPPSSSQTTQTAPSPNAMPSGAAHDVDRRDYPVRRGVDPRDGVVARRSRPRRPPRRPRASSGTPPTSIVADTSFDAGSIRRLGHTASRTPEFTTQIEPSPLAMPSGCRRPHRRLDRHAFAAAPSVEVGAGAVDGPDRRPASPPHAASSEREHAPGTQAAARPPLPERYALGTRPREPRAGPEWAG